MSSLNYQNKQLVWDFFQKFGTLTPENVEDVLSGYFAQDLETDCAHPINSMYGLKDTCEKLWKPFLSSFSKIAVRPYVFFGSKSTGSDNGRFKDTYWVTTTGYFEGLFDKDYLNIPASGKVAFLRFFAMFMIEEGKVKYLRILPDYLELMRQVGIFFNKASGCEHHIPGPYTMDGIMLGETDPAQGKKSVDVLLGWSYCEAKDKFKYQSENFHWYGPAGIGTCIGMEDYVRHHQGPWLKAFPNRCTLGNQEFLYLGEDNYCCVGTWSKYLENPPYEDIYMTHTGEYLGIPATGKGLCIRDYDWYRVDEDGRIVDNWVMVDMIHLFYQMGVDVFERLKNGDYIQIDP